MPIDPGPFLGDGVDMLQDLDIARFRYRAPVLVAASATSLLLAACTQTHNYATVSAGHIYQRIVCKATAPGKCTTRAREACGEYVIVEPIHESADPDSHELTMTVECRPSSAPPIAPAPMPPAPVAVDAGAK